MTDGSELDAHAGCRRDVLGRRKAVGETAVNVGDHQARVEVDALDRPIVDERGEEVFRAGAAAAVDASNGDFVTVWCDSCEEGAFARSGAIIGLIEVVKSAGYVELRGDGVFGADPEIGSDPRNGVSRVADPLRRPEFRRVGEGRGDRPRNVPATYGPEAVRKRSE